jgi:arginyl-tRNA synthetase
MLGDVVADFEAKGFARNSDGATCVFMDNYETPMIIRKKDGAFLYSTTDLATIKYRVEHFKADAALCVVDHRQHEHFDKLFDAARLWGYNDIELTHVSFGTVLGDDGKPFKTRSGDTVGLASLLDEAESRALAIAVEQNPELKQEQQKTIAKAVGIGALKYADLSQNRSSDYKFSYDKMLALRGNTATYLQFSYARVQGIIRKTGADMSEVRANPVPFAFATDVERELAVKLIRFGEAIDEVLVEYKPNLLCSYLFELTQVFFQFLEKCSVKDAETESLKQSRLQFCDLMSRTVETGLGLLGIGVIDQM